MTSNESSQSSQPRRKQIAFGVAGFIAGIVVALLTVRIERLMEIGLHTGAWDAEFLANYTPKHWIVVNVFGIQIWEGRDDNASVGTRSRMVWTACAFCIAVIGAASGVMIAKFNQPSSGAR